MTASSSFLRYIPGSDLLSHTVTHAVPSAVAGLTSVFGMGTGVTLPLWPPGNLVSGVQPRALICEPRDRSSQIISFEYPAIDRSLITHPQRASENGQASRLISIGQLHVSLRFHTRPINLVVYQEPSGTYVQGNLILWRVSRLDAFSVSPFRT